MNELIIVENGINILNPEISNRIAEFERQLKSIKEQEDLLRQAILNEMESKGIKGLESNNLSISYTPATTRETFDSKKFKEDMPEIYDEYIKISPVKSSIKIKVN